MISVILRLYEELNRVLPQEEQKRTIVRTVPAGTDLGGLIDILGLDRQEVDLGLINSEPAAFCRVLAHQDRVSLYPEFESLNLEDASLLRERPLRRTRFVLEPSLVDLARLLRDRGYDCRCPRQAPPSRLAEISREEKRILLTKDPDLAERSSLDRCFCLTSDTPQEQLEEVIQRFQLSQGLR